MGMSVTISAAVAEDAEQIFKLQYLAFQREAELYGNYLIQPLTQSLDSLKGELATDTVLVARLGDEIVGTVRGSVDEEGTAKIAKLCVHPRLQGHGLGARLLRAVEEALAAPAPPPASVCTPVTRASPTCASTARPATSRSAAARPPTACSW